MQTDTSDKTRVHKYAGTALPLWKFKEMTSTNLISREGARAYEHSLAVSPSYPGPLSPRWMSFLSIDSSRLVASIVS